MKLIDNAKAALTKGYTAWVIYIGGVSEAALQLAYGVDLPGWAIWALLGAALVGRVVKQESVSGPAPDTGEDDALGI